MRLSGLVLAALLLVSATLLAQHSSGGGGFSGSHGGYSGGSGFSASSAGSHSSSGSASHVASTGSSSSKPSSSSSKPATKENASQLKKSSWSLLHPFRKSKSPQNAAFKRPAPCLKGLCTPCPPGEARNGKGACVLARNACSYGQSWNGFSCGLPYWSNDCDALAQQLASQRRQMQGQNDYGQSLRLRMLQDQYEQCLRRYGSYAFSSLLLDTPFDIP